jgi:hypothetical protein
MTISKPVTPVNMRDIFIARVERSNVEILLKILERNADATTWIDVLSHGQKGLATVIL